MVYAHYNASYNVRIPRELGLENVKIAHPERNYTKVEISENQYIRLKRAMTLYYECDVSGPMIQNAIHEALEPLIEKYYRVVRRRDIEASRK